MALYTTTGFTNGAQKSLQVKGKKIYAVFPYVVSAKEFCNRGRGLSAAI